jgi:hypothetical protein
VLRQAAATGCASLPRRIDGMLSRLDDLLRREGLLG